MEAQERQQNANSNGLQDLAGTITKSHEAGNRSNTSRAKPQRGNRAFYLYVALPLYGIAFVGCVLQLKRSMEVTFLGENQDAYIASHLPSNFHSSNTRQKSTSSGSAARRERYLGRVLETDEEEEDGEDDDQYSLTEGENVEEIGRNDEHREMDPKQPDRGDTNAGRDYPSFPAADELHRHADIRQKRRERLFNGRLPHNFQTRNFLNATADFSKYPLLESEVLPDMTTHKGGVIFFLHVPKVGGQTIRYHFDRLGQKLSGRKMREYAAMGLEPWMRERITYVTANWLEIFEQEAVPLIDMFLQKDSDNNGQILFVEVHGMDNYNALELEPYIHYWRDKAHKSGVPFFAFTLLREAISAQVSFFNFFYIHPGEVRHCKNPLVKQHPNLRCAGGKTKAGKPRFTASGKRLTKHTPNGATNFSPEELEEFMLQLSYDNPQCLFLARGERTFGDDPDRAAQRSNLLRLECLEVYLSLRRTMDWIGRTDTLSTVTLPMLTAIMFKNPNIGMKLPHLNKSPEEAGYLKVSELRKSTLKALEKKIQLDQELYYRAAQDYTLDRWVNDTSFFKLNEISETSR